MMRYIPTYGFKTAEEEFTKLKPNLVIIDVNLPGKTGYKLLKILKVKSSFPILDLTACDTLSNELEEFFTTSVGAQGDVVKSVTNNTLGTITLTN